MEEAAVNIDDTVHEEPMHEWDRDNPEMSVGTLYPSMNEFRLAVRQYAIVHEFEYDTEHSDKDRFRKDRFRANCSAVSCPWIIRARTQHDGSIRVYFIESFLTFCSSIKYLYCVQCYSFIELISDFFISISRYKSMRGS